ncbi:MAG TPA: capsule assembly Wzi family protein [Cellvibrionaceae bacterium]|nr:capsule assembly Wzi family protein [Cellvibrionaceae bacterium]
MRSARRLLFTHAIVACGWFSPLGDLQAAPWAEPNDRALRHAIEVLRDTGLLTGPITAWPIPWQTLAEALDKLPPHELTEQQQQAVSLLNGAVRNADRFKITSQISTATYPRALGGFGDTEREKSAAAISLEAMGEVFAINLSATYSSDASDGDTWRADNSYLSARVGNWGLGIGALERFWGPAWQDSLILSSNARPSPGLFIQRLSPDAFETPWLSWLGPWQLTTFVNQLESARDYSHTKFWGLRITHSPFSFLELGYSRTALFGGTSRPESLSVITDLLLGRDNRGGDGIADDASNEPGNQLGGFDWRASAHLDNYSGAWYGQVIGEDESGGTPSRNIGTMGLELATATATISHRIWLEGSNTLMRFDRDGMANGTYEHAIYTSGYRYHGRSMGASSDNDSQVYSLGGLHSFEDGDLITWRLGKAYLNRDGSNAPLPGGNPLSERALTLLIADASYQHSLSETSQIIVGGQYLEQPIDARADVLDSNVYITLKSYW